jgi:hypothetical protein
MSLLQLFPSRNPETAGIHSEREHHEQLLGAVDARLAAGFAFVFARIGLHAFGIGSAFHAETGVVERVLMTADSFFHTLKPDVMRSTWLCTVRRRSEGGWLALRIVGRSTNCT